MTNSLGFTQQGLELALALRNKYNEHQPLLAPGEGQRLLMPEHLLNTNIDLQAYDDPLPLAMVATRDPDSPMSIAAAVRMSPKAVSTPVTREVFTMLGDMSKHPVVKQMVDLVSESHFDPDVIGKVQNNARKFVALSRKRYTEALRNNLKMLLEGDIDSRAFVAQFFELSEAGNLRVDIRKRLILGILTSETIRPSIKFLFLEQLGRLPQSVQREIITDALNAPDKPKLEAIKQELAWIRLELKPADAH
ncbi:MAG: hypothetical protein QF393_06560 [Rhodospirillales bacterium]|jgi:hypothetical protein|nr:hypothetical protein [Rhodospirillales bacterium]MDP6645500.1 hypothetical protein [Rhodospirillales bacterium]